VWVERGIHCDTTYSVELHTNNKNTQVKEKDKYEIEKRRGDRTFENACGPLQVGIADHVCRV
jgi:hypothetical protein